MGICYSEFITNLIEKLRDTTIYELLLTTKVTNVLKLCGIHSIQQFLSTPISLFYSQKSVGAKTISSIITTKKYIIRFFVLLDYKLADIPLSNTKLKVHLRELENNNLYKIKDLIEFDGTLSPEVENFRSSLWDVGSYLNNSLKLINNVDITDSEIEEYLTHKFPEADLIDGKISESSIKKHLKEENTSIQAEPILENLLTMEEFNTYIDVLATRIEDYEIEKDLYDWLKARRVNTVADLVSLKELNPQNVNVSDFSGIDIFDDNFILDVSEIENSQKINIEKVKDILGDVYFPFLPIDFTEEQLLKINIALFTKSNCLCPYIKKTIHKFLDNLKPKEHDVLIMRYALDGDNKKRTLDEIGRLYGTTRERIRQIESKGLSRIRDYLSKLGKNNKVDIFLDEIFSIFGEVVVVKDFEELKRYLLLLNDISKTSQIYYDENLKGISNKDNWYANFIEETIDDLTDNKYSSFNIDQMINIKLSLYINKETNEQITNYDKIYHLIKNDFYKKHTIKLDENEYKIVENSKLNSKGKTKKEERNQEILSLFKNIFPDGVHLPIDKNHELEQNLKPLTDVLPYKMSIRTLSEGVIKNSNEVILWDTGIYIHIDNIHIKWSVIDNIIDSIINDFDSGYSNFSIKKIYEKFLDECIGANIPNYTALLGLIKYKNNPRIGNRKLEIFDTYSNGETINKNDIIEEFLYEQNGWVSYEEMKTKFCDEFGWEFYQVDQYVAKSINARKDLNCGFIHLNHLKNNFDRNAFKELLEFLYNQTYYTKESIELEDVRRSSLSKVWSTVLGADVTGKFMCDFIDILISYNPQLQKIPLVFYSGSAYGSDYNKNGVTAKFCSEKVIEAYTSKDFQFIYSGFKNINEDLIKKVISCNIKIANVLYDKEFENFTNFLYSESITKLGMLLYFPFDCIEINKKFTQAQLKKVISKVKSWVLSYKEDTEDNTSSSISSIFWK